MNLEKLWFDVGIKRYTTYLYLCNSVRSRCYLYVIMCKCVSFSYRIRLLQQSHSSPSVTAFDSFSHRIRLLQPLHSTPSATAAVCVNSMK